MFTVKISGESINKTKHIVDHFPAVLAHIASRDLGAALVLNTLCVHFELRILSCHTPPSKLLESSHLRPKTIVGV